MSNKQSSVKSFLLFLFTLTTAIANAQWITKTVDNGLDPVYKIAYCSNTSSTALIKLEQTEEGVAFYLTGGYHCDDYPSVDVAIMVNGDPKRYSFSGTKSSDGTTVFIVMNLLDPEQSDFLKDFKRGTSIVMRINETHCESDYYKFSMANSTKAISFMSLDLP